MNKHFPIEPSNLREGDGVPDFQQMAIILREKGWVIGVCATAGLLVAAVHVKRLPKIYEATSVLQLEARARVLGFESENASSSSSEPGLQTILETFKSRALLQKATQELKLTEDPQFSAAPLSIDQAQAALGSCIEVSQRRGTQLIDITARHRIPETAQTLSNGVANAFIHLQLEQRSKGARAVLDFLMDEAKRLKQQLQKSEEALQNYKEDNQAASLEDRQDTVTTTLKVQGNNLAEARAARIRLESDVADMERFGGDHEGLLRIISISQHPSTLSIRAQISEIQSRISTLRLRYTEKHPTLIQALTQLADAQSALQRMVLQTAATLQTDLQRAQSTERNFENALKDQERQALALNRQSIEYKVLARDVDTDRALYESILKKLKETDVAKGVQLSDLRFFESANLPDAPAKKSTFKFLALGLFAGTAIGSAVVLGSCLMEGVWRTPEEIEASTGLPVLSTVPKMTLPSKGGSLLQSMLDPSQPALEAFRSLRTSLHLSARKRGKNCFLFTSALPDDGKTFCALGYSQTLANQGVRTLLIDADLRSPSVEHLLYGTRDSVGLAEVLEGSVRLNEAIRCTSTSGLDVLPAGRILPNASELLTKKGVHAILETARRRYDCLVIDSAPVQSVSDSLLLAEAVETVCLVVRYATTPKKAALRALHLLQDQGTPVEGIVFNGTMGSSTYGYYAPPGPVAVKC